jgi:primosomal protein N''
MPDADLQFLLKQQKDVLAELAQAREELRGVRADHLAVSLRLSTIEQTLATQSIRFDNMLAEMRRGFERIEAALSARPTL